MITKEEINEYWIKNAESHLRKMEDEWSRVREALEMIK